MGVQVFCAHSLGVRFKVAWNERGSSCHHNGRPHRCTSHFNRSPAEANKVACATSKGVQAPVGAPQLLLLGLVILFVASVRFVFKGWLAWWP